MDVEIHKLLIDYRTREWCLLPYPDHPKGCPNYDKKKDICPPSAPYVEDFIDLQKSVWFVYTTFDLGEHVARMLVKHESWSDRQARCVLYWQKGVVNRLQALAKQFCQEHPGTRYTLCPEAMGVLVTATGLLLGLPIQVKPTTLVHKIALVGYNKDGE